MLLELPRLTNSFRQPFDADQAYLHRKSLFQNLNRCSSAASVGEWELAHKIIYRWDEASFEVRQLYKQFIAAVVELMGGEVVSEEFQEVALNVYMLFSGTAESEADDRERRILSKKINPILTLFSLFQTESERQIDKLRRKEEKKNRRGMDHGTENNLSSLSFSSLLQASEKKNILDDLVGHGDVTQAAATALPQGTIRKHYKGYEEVIVPPAPTAPMRPGEKLVNLINIKF